MRTKAGFIFTAIAATVFFTGTVSSKFLENNYDEYNSHELINSHKVVQVSQTALPEIEVTKLDDVPRSSVGLLPPTVTGFPASMWKESQADDLVRLLRELGSPTSPAVQKLLFQMQWMFLSLAILLEFLKFLKILSNSLYLILLLLETGCKNPFRYTDAREVPHDAKERVKKNIQEVMVATQFIGDGACCAGGSWHACGLRVPAHLSDTKVGRCKRKQVRTRRAQNQRNKNTNPLPSENFHASEFSPVPRAHPDSAPPSTVHTDLCVPVVCRAS